MTAPKTDLDRAIEVVERRIATIKETFDRHDKDLRNNERCMLGGASAELKALLSDLRALKDSNDGR